ncbi:hypothetical protein [uncultured Friedmanniella sp.]|uniref:hypothetical protein n=1 Tax=uncultured Friedmanniella sp. TaxID=335381 RepID=UPI0035CA21D6
MSVEQRLARLWEGGPNVYHARDLDLVEECETWCERGGLDGGAAGVGGCAEGRCDEGAEGSALTGAALLGDMATDVPRVAAGGDGEDGVAFDSEVVAGAGLGGERGLQG